MNHSSISNSSLSCDNSTPVTSIINGCKELKKKSKKKNKKGATTVKLSTDPQSVAARLRRHRISDRFKTLQSLVPGGSKMDTVSMLEEAIQYVKFLKNQIWLHQAMISFMGHNVDQYDPTLINNLPPNNLSSPLPFDHHQQFDLFNNYYSGDHHHQVQASVTQVGFPDSWTFVPDNPFMYF